MNPPTTAVDTEVAELPSVEAKMAYLALQMVDTDMVLKLASAIITRRVQQRTPEQVARLLTARGDAAKPLIERRSGPSISTAEAAERLATSDETIRKRVERGMYIGYPDLSKKERLRLPQWQFSGPRDVHAWVEPLVQAFGNNGWALLDFLTIPRTGKIGEKTFDEESFLARLQAGDIQLVLDAAHRANPQ
jgi:hypothetical protein